MVTEPLLQTESALADLAEQFEHWRRSRATAQERIPAALWDQAVALTTVLAGSQVAKRLRLSPTDLKKQGLARQTAIPATAVAPYPGFVEVTAPAFEPAAPSPTLIEVERPDGVRLRLQYRDSPPLAALLRAFLEPAGCCNSPPRVGSCWPWPPSISAKALMG
jgi:hypothetical protein